MLDRKLFVFSVVAWFLALGLGILVGMGAGGGGILDARLESWLSELEADLERLRSEHGALRDTLAEKEGVLDALLEDAIKERLQGMTVWIDQDDTGTDRVLWLLETAGAEVVTGNLPADVAVTTTAGLVATGMSPAVLVLGDGGAAGNWERDPQGVLRAEVGLESPLDGLRLVRFLETLYGALEGGIPGQGEK